MLVRLLLLKKLSPALFLLRLAGLIAFGLLFLAFVAECGYLLYRGLRHETSSRLIHAVERRR